MSWVLHEKGRYGLGLRDRALTLHGEVPCDEIWESVRASDIRYVPIVSAHERRVVVREEVG